MDTFDREGIEILRGPKGTLQGRNVTGGAVLLTTRRPGDAFAAYGPVGIETGPEYNLAGSVGGPIVADKLLATLSAYYRIDRGCFDNPSLGRIVWRVRNCFLRPKVFFTLGVSATETILSPFSL